MKRSTSSGATIFWVLMTLLLLAVLLGTYIVPQYRMQRLLAETPATPENIVNSQSGLTISGIVVGVALDDRFVVLYGTGSIASSYPEQRQMIDFAPSEEGGLYVYIALKKGEVEQQLVVGPVTASFTEPKNMKNFR